MDQDDPRATQVYNTTNQSQQISQVINQLQKNNHINAFFVLTHFLDCPEIKNQPDFFQMLFNKNLDTVLQLIQWMLIPKQIIKKKKIKANVESYPYQCREFLKDNWCFYQQLYIAIRKKRIQFKNIFKFLHKEYYDHTTIHTALGYFSDVMIPFIKYQFSGSFNLIKTLQHELSAEQQQIQTYSILKIFTQNLIDQLVVHSHHDAIFQFIKNLILNSLEDSTQICQAKKIFSKLLRQCMVEDIFMKFSQSPFFQSLHMEEIGRCYQLYENLAVFLKQILQNIQPSQQLPRITTCLIQVIVDSGILTYCLRQIPQSRYCGMIRPKDQPVHNNSVLKLYSSASLTFQDGKIVMQNDTKEKEPNYSLSQTSRDGKDSNSGTLGGGNFLDVQENQMVESLLKILHTLVSIFHHMPKTFKTKIEQQSATPIHSYQLPTQISFTSVTEFIDNDKFLFNHTVPPQRRSRSGSNNATTPTSPNSFGITTPHSPTPFSPKKLKKCHKEITFQQYTTLLLLYHTQIQQIFNTLETTLKLVYNIPPSTTPPSNTPQTNNNNSTQSPNQAQRNTTTTAPLNLSSSAFNTNTNNQYHSYHKIIPFSSGENIRCVSQMKYQFFRLLYQCLVVWQASLTQHDQNSNTKNNVIEIKSQKSITSVKSLKQLSPSKQPTQQQTSQQKYQTPQKQTQQQIKQHQQQSPQQSQQNIQIITLPTFKFPKQKLYLIEIIKRYLIQNRWNNINQGILIQICHKLVISNYEYIKKNLEKDKLKKFSDSFLAYLIENFTKRDFVFLNTVKFTPQGNLYALYSIARDLAHSLNGANQLVIFLNQFEPWKKFIMNDLKNFQERLFPNSTKPQFDDSLQNETIKLKVDQADSIKKLIQNISTTKKWPTRTPKSKPLSKGTKSHRNSVQLPQTKSTTDDKNITYSNKKKQAQNQFDSYLNQNGSKIEDQIFVGKQLGLKKQVSDVCQFQGDGLQMGKKLSRTHEIQRESSHNF